MLLVSEEQRGPLTLQEGKSKDCKHPFKNANMEMRVDIYENDDGNMCVCVGGGVCVSVCVCMCLC